MRYEFFELLKLLDGIGLLLLVEEVFVKLPILHWLALKVKEATDEARLLQRRDRFGKQSLHFEIIFSVNVRLRNLSQVEILAQHFIYQSLSIGNQRLIINLFLATASIGCHFLLLLFGRFTAAILLLLLHYSRFLPFE